MPCLTLLPPTTSSPTSPPSATSGRHQIDALPSQPSRSARRTLVRLKCRPHRVGRHQMRKTPLLYVARIVHCPCPLPLAIWTPSYLGKDTAGYSIAQVPSYAFAISFRFRRVRSPFFSFPIRFRPHHRARLLVSHPPPSARSSSRSRPRIQLNFESSDFMTPHRLCRWRHLF